MKLKDKIAIITGVSSGIGKAIAMLFAKEGANVVAAARRKEKLDEIAGQAEKQGRRIIPVCTDVCLLYTSSESA